MSYEIRALSFGEILDAGFRLLRNHFVLLVGIAAVLYVPLSLAQQALVPVQGAVPTPGQVGGLVGAGLLAGALLYPIVMAAVTHAIGTLYLGGGAALGGSLRVGLSILLPLVGTQILIVLAELAGFLLLIVPGIWLTLAFLLAPQVMVLERRFGFAAMMRSLELMKGEKGRGFGLALVSSLFALVIQAGISILGLLVPPLAPLFAAFAQSVGLAYASAVLVIFYFDVRCRKEAFDLEHLAELIEREARPGAPAPIG